MDVDRGNPLVSVAWWSGRKDKSVADCPSRVKADTRWDEARWGP